MSSRHNHEGLYEIRCAVFHIQRHIILLYLTLQNLLDKEELNDELKLYIIRHYYKHTVLSTL